LRSGHPEQCHPTAASVWRQEALISRQRVQAIHGFPPPIKEEYLLSGYLEPTNEPYASPKSPASKLARLTTANTAPIYLCGPDQCLWPQTIRPEEPIHPALLQRFHERGRATRRSPSGDRTPLREFIYADTAGFVLLQHYKGRKIINIGTESEISTRELAS